MAQKKEAASTTPTLVPSGSRDLVMDIPVALSVELGQTQLEVRDVLNLTTGSVIELNKSEEEPVELRVNGRLIARGEVVVVNNCLAVKVTEILTA